MEHQIWTTDENGREILVATTKIGSDAGVVFDAVVDARAFVEWRTASHDQHKGRLFRGWDGEEKKFYGPSVEANLA